MSPNNIDKKSSEDKDVSSSSFSSSSSWFDWLFEFQDDQRLERLQQHCPKLERLLEDCRKSGRSSSEKLEEKGLALRNIKYFDWRGITKKHPEIETLCSREEHLVWASRAVAIGCGRELGALKTCFQNEGAYKVLTSSTTSYERRQGEEKEHQQQQTMIPCHDLQQKLGNCVTIGANELYERRKRRQDATGKSNEISR